MNLQDEIIKELTDRLADLGAEAIKSGYSGRLWLRIAQSDISVGVRVEVSIEVEDTFIIGEAFVRRVGVNDHPGDFAYGAPDMGYYREEMPLADPDVLDNMEKWTIETYTECLKDILREVVIPCLESFEDIVSQLDTALMFLPKANAKRKEGSYDRQGTNGQTEKGEPKSHR